MNNFARLVFSPGRIFLVDGLGAVFSAVMLGVVLAAFVPFFGMPRAVLCPLSGTAACLAVYSFSCHLLKPRRWQIFLRNIAGLNLAYCAASVVLMYVFWNSLTIWGTVYFVSEKLVVMGLAFLELSISRTDSPRRITPD